MTNAEARMTNQIKRTSSLQTARGNGTRENRIMKPSTPHFNRRQFAKASLLAGAAVASGAVALAEETKRIRTGIIGCGSVSGSYLPVLTKCPYVEVVSLCDIRP